MGVRDNIYNTRRGFPVSFMAISEGYVNIYPGRIRYAPHDTNPNAGALFTSTIVYAKFPGEKPLPIQVHIDESGLVRLGFVEVRLNENGVEQVRWRDGKLHSLEETMLKNLEECSARSEKSENPGCLVKYRTNGTFEIVQYDPQLD